MPEGKDTDRQGGGRIDRDTGEVRETVKVEPYWPSMHRLFSEAGPPKSGTPEREQWDLAKAEVHQYMHTDQYTAQAADPDHEQHFAGHEQWKKDNPL
jgi:hypothetical protein